MAPLLAALLAACASPAPPAAPEEPPPLACRIEGPSTCALGEAPALRVVLENRTGETVVLAGALNGSWNGRRYPHCLFEVTGPDGSSVEDGLTCGNMNYLRAADFVPVPPGGTFDPFLAIDGYGFFRSERMAARHFPKPGVYRVRFVYDTACGDWLRWEGSPLVRDYRPSLEVRTLWSRVPRLRVESPEFVLTVVE